MFDELIHKFLPIPVYNGLAYKVRISKPSLSDTLTLFECL